MTSILAKTLCTQIESFFGGGQCYLLSKGRVGLYAGLLAMGLPPGRKVIIPGYTCKVVPAAVQYAGLKPAYVDIDPRTYNVNPDLLDDAYTNDVSALIVQHTYGITCDMAAIKAWADSKRLPVIEDCCHALGTRFQGQLCGTFGTFAFMSGQWNKPFSTGLGGMLLVNDVSLAERVNQVIREEAGQPGLVRNIVLHFQILAFGLLVNPHTAAKAARLYRVLTRYGLVIGNSSKDELKGKMPDSYLSTMAPCQIRKGIREMARVEDNIRHRINLTALYSQRLPEVGFPAVRFGPPGEIPLLRYPVRVANKNEVLQKAERMNVEIGAWFDAPLHPARIRMEGYGYRPGSCPEGESASDQVINLPTHLKVNHTIAERTLDFIATYARPI